MTRLMKSRLLTGTVGMGLLPLGTGTAHAHVLPSLESITADGPNYTYTYDVALDSQRRIAHNDQLPIDQVAGQHALSAASATRGWERGRRARHRPSSSPRPVVLGRGGRGVRVCRTLVRPKEPRRRRRCNRLRLSPA